MSGNYTGNLARRLQEEDAAEVAPDCEQQVREARERHPGATVYYDDELQDVVVDLSSEGE
jgi:hypothetical protein